MRDALGVLFDTWSTGHDETGMARPVHLAAVQVRAIVEAPAAVQWTADYF